MRKSEMIEPESIEQKLLKMGTTRLTEIVISALCSKTRGRFSCLGFDLASPGRYHHLVSAYRNLDDCYQDKRTVPVSSRVLHLVKTAISREDLDSRRR